MKNTLYLLIFTSILPILHIFIGIENIIPGWLGRLSLAIMQISFMLLLLGYIAERNSKK
ncbi:MULTISPECIES: hypothetical protein [Brochothrix]|uniref:hypothetical protein n=1 Tax=Brochothrix TaxID=2755 RepID=UPI0004B484A1|nr:MULTISPECIES: hypothetical protein [Brochothrix]MBR5527315.1 hypothetical protein [Brochothrix sp.]MDO7863607.1 hypothetical protein [Brochothrix thermosphacta]WKK68419.1 hypothetical protein Q0G00_08855 [Brochothrix thermosphacta]SOC18871.1 hypothetical protein BTH160X_220026 [Brochothrix thermosphacta]SPN74574.1 hypothetical protein BTEBP_100026 [Brochothrix thermosphacta]